MTEENIYITISKELGYLCINEACRHNCPCGENSDTHLHWDPKIGTGGAYLCVECGFTIMTKPMIKRLTKLGG